MAPVELSGAIVMVVAISNSILFCNLFILFNTNLMND